MTTAWIDGPIRIPDLLRRAPQTRPVLDRYGLKGCGGAGGPVETLAFFAKAHEVPLPRLLDELRAAALVPGAAPPPEPPGLGDAIYRPFFKAGIAVVLTLGAVWGAYLLLRIGFGGSFRAVGLHEVNAHGHAQIFGWVGLFVMGFAYQAFPRFKHATLSHPRLALASLVLMLAGLIARSVAEPLADGLSALGGVAVGASALEVAAVGLFAFVLAATWRRSGKPLAVYDYWVIAAVAWFAVQAVGEGVYLMSTLATPPDQLVPLVARWQGALREAQIHGFALLIVLGVSQRLFPHFYGFPAPNRRLSLAALALLNVAVVGEIVGLIGMRDGRGFAALWYAAVLLLAATATVLVRDWHLFRRPPESDRGLKFLRAAYVWLFVSLGLLVLLPAYQFGLLPWLAPASAAAQTGFSHAYYGAVRHAITVGFVSLMIVGVAAKVVPTLNGVDVRRLSPLWAPFLLLNVGCALRVTAQTLTDFTESAFPFAGVSGLLEVTGLALWGVHLWRVMAGRVKEGGPAAEPLTPAERIEGRHTVGEVLDLHPELLPTFAAFGFRPLLSPILRRTLARGVTLEQACRREGVDLAVLLEALNAGRPRGARRALAVVEASPEEGACCAGCAQRL